MFHKARHDEACPVRQEYVAVNSHILISDLADEIQTVVFRELQFELKLCLCKHRSMYITNKSFKFLEE